MKGVGEPRVGSRLQSNCTTQRAKVDTLMPLGFFHTFPSPELPTSTPFYAYYAFYAQENIIP
jgi:hypothetical protein